MTHADIKHILMHRIIPIWHNHLCAFISAMVLFVAVSRYDRPSCTHSNSINSPPRARYEPVAAKGAAMMAPIWPSGRGPSVTATSITTASQKSSSHISPKGRLWLSSSTHRHVHQANP